MLGSIIGMLEVELTSAEPEQAIAALNSAGIEILLLNQTDALTSCFYIRRQDYKTIKTICQKRGETIRIKKNHGLYWSAKTLLLRPVLLLGVITLLTIVLFLPTRVLFVKVEGNQSIPAKRILESAEECGIAFGASRKEVRSEKMKNALLSAIPELQWAGVNTNGCVATMSVRERTVSDEHPQEYWVSNIVAQRDGFILSGTVTQGSGVFRPGQTVNAGQILISGYTDCGICIRAERAKGEVFAQTNRDLHIHMPSHCLQRVNKKNIKRKISLLIRKKRINLWKDSGISDSSCVRIYEEYYVPLPGGFQLPFALCIEKYIFYEMQRETISKPEAEGSLMRFSDNYLQQQMVAGEIKDKSCTLICHTDTYCLKGTCVCVEMIGREQIGDTNGETG